MNSESRPYTVQWLLLVIAIIAVAGGLAWNAADDRARIDAQERARVSAHAGVVEQNLERQLLAVDRALAAVRGDLGELLAWPDALQLINRRLTVTSEAIPGVRSALLIDANGVCIASNRAELIGISFRDGERYRTISREPDADTLYVSAPFKTPTGIVAIGLSKAVLNDRGAFAGYLIAILDSEFFRTLLNSVLYAPDMRAAAVHIDGQVVFRIPDPENRIGTDIRIPGSAFLKHVESGELHTVQTDTVFFDGTPRLTAIRTLQPTAVRMDKPLVVITSRSLAAIFGPWRRRVLIEAILVGAFSLLCMAALSFYHRRRRAFDRVTQHEEAQRRQAEEQLRRSEENLAVTLQSIGDAVIVADTGGRVVRMNSTAERLTGWPLAEASGLPLQEVFRIVNTETRAPADDPVERAMQTGAAVGLSNHTALLARDGREYQIADSAAPIRHADGTISGVVLVFSDVTERYRMAEELRDRESLLRTISDHARIGMVMVTRQHRYVFANAAYAKLHGLDLNGLKGRHLAEVLGAYYEQRGRSILERAFGGESVTDDATLPPLKPGEPERHISISIEPPVETRHGPCVIVLLANITDRKLAERERAQLAAVVESTYDAIVLRALDDSIIGWNAAAERIFGWRKDEAIGRTFRTLLSTTPEESKRYRFEKVLRGESIPLMEDTRRRKDGTTVEVETMLSAVRDDTGKVIAAAAIMRDITERKQAESLRRRLATAVEGSSDAIYIRDTDRKIVYWNGAAARLFGYAPEEIIGKDNAFMVPSDMLVERESNWARLEHGEPLHNVETVRYRKDGSAVYIALSASRIVDERGNIYGVVTVVRDISERKRAEAELLASRNKLQAALESMSDTVLISDARGRFIEFNEAFVAFHKFKSKAECAKTLAEYPLFTEIYTVDGEYLPPEQWPVSRALRGESGVGVEFTLRRKDTGETRIGSYNYSPIRDQEGAIAGAVVTGRDVTAAKQAQGEREELEMQLREAQKMQAVGTLAGGIAHDFNNIIATIIGNAELAQEDAGDRSAVLASIREILKASGRGRDLVQQILSFSRRQPTELKRIAPESVVLEAVRLLRSTLPKRVSLDVACAHGVPDFMADATQIQQAIINLATNALHAIPSGPGLIRIALDSVRLDATFAQSDRQLQDLLARHPGTTVRIAVSDTGTGMDAATMARIFEPFFTTKPVNEGTGLGLPVVHGIVQGHGGAITVESELGKGSTFSLFFPAATKPSAAEQANASPAPGRTSTGRSHGLRLLYIDDDEMLVTLIVRTLSRRGFEITAHTDPREGLKLLRADPEAFDLLLTDFNMPGMSGLDVARESRAIRDNLPVVITSGFVDDTVIAQAREAGAWELVSKVDSVDALCASLERLALRI